MNTHGVLSTGLTRSRFCFKINIFDFKYKCIFHKKKFADNKYSHAGRHYSAEIIFEAIKIQVAFYLRRKFKIVLKKNKKKKRIRETIKPYQSDDGDSDLSVF